MIIAPRVWGFVSTTAHPLGCQLNVTDQIRTTRAHGLRTDGPKRVLVVGASTGYGLAARITAAFGFGAATLGVFHGRPATGHRPAGAGWYNTAALHAAARAAGLAAVSVNGDAFAPATRARVAALARDRLGGPIDLLVYSLAAPSLRDPASGRLIHTALKPVGASFTATTIDTDRDRLAPVALAPASAQEIEDTIAVMGGAPWQAWIDDLAGVGALAPTARTVAFGYVGPELTWPIYRDGTIGLAKQDLERRARELCRARGDAGFARIAVLPSIVTQASVAIPAVPLYQAILQRVLRERGVGTSAIGCQNRLWREYLHPADAPAVADAHHRFRLDGEELAADVQRDCRRVWHAVTGHNLFHATDYALLKRDFLRLFGFARDDVDYAADVDPQVDFDCASP